MELDKQILVRPADNHVRDNGAEPVFEERSVETVESASVARRFCSPSQLRDGRVSARLGTPWHHCVVLRRFI
ncbi:hypothetical protein ACSD7O_00370 [Methylorubrum extorquens]|uniref:hypothetical protein n=1 Tax=Methylorubrum extorquens TaxID=408 RepID=UPI003F607517